MKKIFLIINIILLVYCSNRKLNKEIETTSIKVKINKIIKEVGKKGTLVLYTNFMYDGSFQITDTQRNTYFSMNIIGKNQNKFEIQCGLWKPEIHDLYIFCDINEEIPEDTYTLEKKDISFFYKEEYNIIITISQELTFTKLNLDIIDLYANKQIIDLNSNENEFELKFKIVNYNKEKIYLCNSYPLKVLDDCDQKNDELICKINRNDIEPLILIHL